MIVFGRGFGAMASADDLSRVYAEIAFYIGREAGKGINNAVVLTVAVGFLSRA